MDVGSAKAIAREWVEANRQDWPDPRAIGFDSPAAGERKLAQAWALHDRVFAVTDEIIATCPGIVDERVG